MLAELVSPLALLYGASDRQTSLIETLLLEPYQGEMAWFPALLQTLWIAHYINRAIIYVLRVPAMSPIPIWTCFSMATFNLMNGWVNGYWLRYYHSRTSNLLASDTTARTMFMIYLGIFLIGWFVNFYSEGQLFKAQREGIRRAQLGKQLNKYQIPYGGLYRFISCPHYFGEIIEWCGWAWMMGDVPGYLFALATMANLIPRALTIHDWYHRVFSEYPPERRAVLPWLL
jgi:3-oxo-5-alpha-steroid 4-dehydrogenase 1